MGYIKRRKYQRSKMKFSKQITIKLTDEQFAKLEAFIEKLDLPTTIATVVRMLIDKWCPPSLKDTK